LIAGRIEPVFSKKTAAAIIFTLGLSVVGTPTVFATLRNEDGYDLWLRYLPVETEWQAKYRTSATEVVTPQTTRTEQAAALELTRGLSGLLGKDTRQSSQVTTEGAIVLGTPASSPIIAALKLDLSQLGNEGYTIKTAQWQGHRITAVAANADIGVLYGTFAYLRLFETRQPVDHLAISDAPRIPLRLLNHWDNLDRMIERGYAGFSLWDWQKLPDYLDPRYTDYARANASIGINGAVLNNVNANAQILKPMYLEKVAALANVLRPYGIRVYLSARFSAPREIGGLNTADPFDPDVRSWWKAKTEEIYRYVPDFGGYLVKANSEGQPGPQDYGRTHADGANMLAEALAPHHGVVIWRAFVYSNETPVDRAKQAYDEFVPLEGKFLPNVWVQVKNGPIDFQPREPFHPLFGAMPHSNLMMEFQITKEYLGFATQLVYLAPLFKETLDADTFRPHAGSPVSQHVTGIAGVANTGTDRNWTGSHFDQANWYAFGRLAWNPELTSEAIAREWIGMTFTNDPRFVNPVVSMMLRSREAAVNYMTPLGLHHQMGANGHYGPAPWFAGGPRADWTCVYYNRAAHDGIGFDRTATGSNAVAQYAPEVASEFADLKIIPEKYLLWFHHLPWDYKTRSGLTLWDDLVKHYSDGVSEIVQFRKTWAGLSDFVDPERYAQAASFLEIQEKEARWWRDASIAYFQSISKKPLSPGYAPPEHTLDYYKSLEFTYVPGTGR
jgi:alpha-glucuronidase